MIFINKNGYPIPDILLVEGAVKRQQHIDDFSADEDNYKLNTRAVRKFPFDGDIYGHETVKESLEIIQNFKCCFCESKYKHITSGDVEHFRPKAGYSQGVGLQFTRPGYFWLAYDWTNLLVSCEVCNRRKKGNYFPLSNPNSRSTTYSSDITIEEPWFINPSIIDPESHITFYKEVPMHISFQGAKTIIYLELDRPELNEMRLQKLNDLKTLENSYVISAGYPTEDRILENLLDRLRVVLQNNGEYYNMIKTNFRKYLPLL